MRTPQSHQRLLKLYDTHSERVFRFCLRLSFGCQEDAEDLTQEVFLAALTGLSRFAGRSTTQTWLFRIAVFKSRELRLRRENFPMISVPQELPTPSSERQILIRMNLERALECLTEAQHEAFLLVKAEGFTSKEVREFCKSHRERCRAACTKRPSNYALFSPRNAGDLR